VAITGDIADKGAPGDYEEAGRCINDSLMKRLPRGFRKDRILMVPGNHDVDRTAVKRSAELLQQDLIKVQSQEKIADILNDEDERSGLLKRHARYLEFVNRYRGSRQKTTRAMVVDDDQHQRYACAFCRALFLMDVSFR
jgi:hypothetical protein